ncbi:MAG: helicase, partial [Bacillota bacterium]
DSEEAEFVVNTAAQWGEDWLGAYNEVDCERAADVFSDCEDRLDKAFDAFCAAQKREDNDRRHMMMSSIERHLESQRERILERIRRYRMEGSDKQRRLIPAEEGKLKHLTARLGAKIESLRHKDKLQAAHSFVSGGIIRIY